VWDDDEVHFEKKKRYAIIMLSLSVCVCVLFFQFINDSSDFIKASPAKVNTRESLMNGSSPLNGDVFASIGTQGVFYRVFLTS